VSIDNENRQFTFAVQPQAIVKPAPKSASKVRKLATPVIAAIVSGLVAGGAGAFIVGGAGHGSTVVVNNTESVNWVTGVAAKVLPSVVSISVGASSSGGTGSGVALTKDGLILTNAHVVTLDGETNNVTIQVRNSDGVVTPAKVVGIDPTNDLAVIRTSGNFTPIEFGDSSKVNVGDNVVAIGAPLGLDESVTTGIISALNRTIQVASSAVPDGSLQLWSGSGAAPVSLRVLQTDAAINPGNSGGALLNAQGQLIGINVAIATASSNTSSTQSGSIGVGFSIPSNIAKGIADQLIKSGKASHALLGALVTDSATGSSVAAFTNGAKVVKLTPGGAAERGGLKVGDVVVEFQGQVIDSASELTAAVRLEKANSKASLVVIRNGQKLTLNVTLGDAANAN
jgi:putative serine protease PepD